MTTRLRPPVPDLLADLERGVADPDNETPSVLHVRALRSLAAEGSAGGVTATVNGYGDLKAIQIPPEALDDLPRLGRRARRAINLALNESEHRQPPLPASFGHNLFGPSYFPPPRPPTSAHYGGPVTPEDTGRWRGCLPDVDEARLDAYIDAAYIVRERILSDARRVELAGDDLVDMLLVVYLYLARPRLHAAYVRRTAGVTDAGSLEWFRVEVGVSLTRYIRDRRLEIAARMIYRSELTLEEIAPVFSFPDADELSRVIRIWSGKTPEDLRFFWEYAGLDYVLLMWTVTGAASQGQAERVRENLGRLVQRVMLPVA